MNKKKQKLFLPEIVSKASSFIFLSKN